jgi:hypothetical protein
MPLKNNILFLHVPRTGGTSITHAMGLNFTSSEEDLYCPRRALQHYTARQINGKGVEWDKAFSVIRDPVMRLQSEWFLGYDNYRRIALERELTLPELFWRICKRNKESKGYYCHFSSYSFMLKGIENIRLLDFHRLQSDWEVMVDEWNLPFDRQLKKIHSTKSRGREKMPYSLKQDLAQLYKEDYEFLRTKGFNWA